MSLSVKGKLTRKLSVESGTSKAGKEWKKQSFLLDTGAQYNPEICFQLFGDEKIEILNHHNEGDEVEVSFNLSSKELMKKILEAPIIRCDEVPWSFLGLSMAGWNGILSILFSSCWLKASFK